MNRMDSKLGYVDALRGIAILMVILVHSAEAVPELLPIVRRLATYGQTGVQLFFVASAYTLCISHARRADEPHALMSFYLRRFFRIAPLYYVAILLYLLFNLFVIYRDQSGNFMPLPYSAFDVMSNFLFIHGFIPSANNTVVPGGWSIGAEMIFYAGFPALFALACRLSKLGPFTLLVLAGACTLLYATAQALVYAATGLAIHNSSFFFFSIINQFPAFALGVAVYFLCRDRPDWLGTSWRPSAKAFGVTSAIALVLWLIDSALLYTVIPAVAAVSFMFLLNWLRISRPRLRFLQSVGRVSFSLYVFHFLFAYYAVPNLIRALPIELPPEVILLISCPLVFVLTYPIALVTERLVEAKGISFGARMIRQSRTAVPPVPVEHGPSVVGVDRLARTVEHRANDRQVAQQL